MEITPRARPRRLLPFAVLLVPIVVIAAIVAVDSVRTARVTTTRSRSFRRAGRCRG